MACDSNRIGYFRQFAHKMPTWAEPLGLHEERACVQWWEGIYRVAKQRAKQGADGSVLKAGSTQRAAWAMLDEMARAGWPNPHRGSSLSSIIGSVDGWAALWLTLQAVERLENLPPLALEMVLSKVVEQPQRSPHCPHCGRFLSTRNRPHTCPPSNEPYLAEDTDSASSVVHSGASVGEGGFDHISDSPALPLSHLYYLGFGSNMDADRMRSRGIPWNRRLGVRVPGWTLAFNKRGGERGVGYANLVPTPGADQTEAVLYRITLESLARLGVYEGYPTHYGLQPVAVTLPDGTVTTAMMYVASPSQTAKGLAPRPEYLAHLQAGGDLLSLGYLAGLKATPVCEFTHPTYSSAKGSSNRGYPAKEGGSPPLGGDPPPWGRSWSYRSQEVSPKLALQSGIPFGQILTLLGDQNPLVRWHAVRSLALLTEKGTSVPVEWVPELLSLLSDDDVDVRSVTQRWWDRQGGKQEALRGAVVKVMKATDSEYRIAAAQALRSHTDSDEVAAALLDYIRVAGLSATDQGLLQWVDATWDDAANHPRLGPPAWLKTVRDLQQDDQERDLESRLPVFVYGTLRNGQGNYRGLLQGTTDRETAAVGENLAMYSRGLAWVLDSPHDRVRGELMWVSSFNYAETISKLDSLEGFDPATRTGMYVRVMRNFIYYQNGHPLRTKAWLYQRGSRAKGELLSPSFYVPNGDWIAQIEQESARADLERPVPPPPAVIERTNESPNNTAWDAFDDSSRLHEVVMSPPYADVLAYPLTEPQKSTEMDHSLPSPFIDRDATLESFNLKSVAQASSLWADSRQALTLAEGTAKELRDSTLGSLAVVEETLSMHPISQVRAAFWNNDAFFLTPKALDSAVLASTRAWQEDGPDQAPVGLCQYCARFKIVEEGCPCGEDEVSAQWDARFDLGGNPPYNTTCIRVLERLLTSNDFLLREKAEILAQSLAESPPGWWWMLHRIGQGEPNFDQLLQKPLLADPQLLARFTQFLLNSASGPPEAERSLGRELVKKWLLTAVN